jgi:glutaminyl-peptide cyclotransferase
MHRATALLTLFAGAALGAEFSGASALAYTRKAVAIGPRPSGSTAIAGLQKWIAAELRARKVAVIEEPFTARTPRGPLPMRNLIARFPGHSGRAIVVSGHYDTKAIPGIKFVGANDGGSSTGLLLELARVLAGAPRLDDVYLVWFDGEEAIEQWSETDGLYGSRHQAARWAADGTLERIRAMVNIDMIGDRDLGILDEVNSSLPLRRLIRHIATGLGYGRHFLSDTYAIEDDHIPFVKLGVPAANLIDFNYGPGNSWWHTEKDTIDKLAAPSFEVVGKVVLELIRRLEK